MRKIITFRFITAIVMLTVAVFVLSGCGQTPATNQEEVNHNADPNSADTSEEDHAGPVTSYREELSDPDLVDDFENVTIAAGKDIYAEIGFVTWSDGSEVALEVLDLTGETSPAEGLPESKQGLALSVNIGSGGWAGMSHSFASPALDQWVPRDWSAYEGISFWVYGQGTEGSLLFEILENRNPDSEVDDAERWNFTFDDDFTGWKQVEVPFSDFKRKDIGNGAPNDGLSLEEVHGYAFGGFGAKVIGSQTYYLDDVRLYGIAPEKPVLFNFDKQIYQVTEGGKTKITIELNKPASIEVSIDLSVAERVAQPGEDFFIETGTITFEPGETEKTLEFQAVDDTHSEGIEQFVVTLSNPAGAEVGPFRRAVCMLRDNDSPDPNLLFDFESFPGLVASPGVTLSLLPIGESELLAFEGQVGMDRVLGAKNLEGTGYFGRSFPVAQDWRDYTGVQFWMYGYNSGSRLNFEVQLNKVEDLDGDLALVWSDEFEGAAGKSPDFFVWQPELGDGKLNNLEGWGNAELEHYTGNPENVSFDGEGNLAITARKVDSSESILQCWYGPCEYTSSRLITKNKLELQYGRIEARMKVPEGYGLWPAFWMLGTNIDEVSWPQSGEIDIVEYLGRMPNKVVGSIHGPGYSGAANVGQEFALSEGSVFDDFHVFAIEWSPGKITWYLDDQVYHSATPEDLPDGSEWVFDQPGFIILNLAVGGNYPGNPDENTPFPAELLIDYVRVYQTPATYQTASVTVLDNFEGWQLVRIPFTELIVETEGIDLNNVWGYSIELAGFSEEDLLIDDFGFYYEE